MVFDVDIWLKAFVQAVQARLGPRIRLIGLQGSFSRGEASEGSDVDVVRGFEHQVGMDFIGDDGYIVPAAEFADPEQLIAGENPAGRVVGIAEEKCACFGEFAIEILEIDLETTSRVA